MGILGNLGRIVVANMRIESCHKHERLMEQFVDSLTIGLDSNDAVTGEGLTGITNESHGLEDITNNHWFKDVQFEMAVAPTDTHGHLVPHHLSSDHCECLTLRGVDLPWHDAAPRLILWQDQLPQPTPWPRAQEPDVVGNLHETNGRHVQRSVHLHHGVFSSQCLKLVGCGDKWQLCQFGQLGTDFLVESLAGVESSPDGSSSDGQLVETWQSGLHPGNIVSDLLDIATELLTQTERNSILQLFTRVFREEEKNTTKQGGIYLESHAIFF